MTILEARQERLFAPESVVSVTDEDGFGATSKELLIKGRGARDKAISRTE